MQARTATLFMIGCLIIFMLTGCWSKVEVNKVAIVTAVGLDQTEQGKIQLSLELAIPKMLGGPNQSGGEKQGGKAGWILSAEGNTIMEAYALIQQKVPRKIVFYHNRVIVISERLARSGVLPVLDFFERYKQSQIRNHILFTRNDAKEILEFKPAFGKLSSEILRDEAKSKRNVGVRLLHFVDMMTAPGDAPMTAQVWLAPAQAGKNGTAKSGNITNKSLSLSGAAVFRKDKLIGWLNETETTGAMWLKNRMQDAVTTIHVPDAQGGGRFSVQIVQSNTKYKTLLNHKGVLIQVDIQANISIYENSSKLNMSDPKGLNYAEGLVRDNVKATIEEVCKKAQQEYKSDILGLGHVVYRQHPKQWNSMYRLKWDERFPEVSVSVAPHISVSQIGLTNKSIEMEEERKKEPHD
ncbi:Ger(x)C family spore germination protein [Paenibacillus hodogayensis]|uniref:Ger(X)C family spore germination protein n=1 Tax=Paenibacillus hodogayensis TaxID=279208 RepID=A0ABV5VPI0_9BACL